MNLTLLLNAFMNNVFIVSVSVKMNQFMIL